MILYAIRAIIIAERQNRSYGIPVRLWMIP